MTDVFLVHANIREKKLYHLFQSHDLFQAVCNRVSGGSWRHFKELLEVWESQRIDWSLFEEKAESGQKGGGDLGCRFRRVHDSIPSTLRTEVSAWQRWQLGFLHKWGSSCIIFVLSCITFSLFLSLSLFPTNTYTRISLLPPCHML